MTYSPSRLTELEEAAKAAKAAISERASSDSRSRAQRVARTFRVAANPAEILALIAHVREVEAEREQSPGPMDIGGFEGDIFFGDPRNPTRGTHRWQVGAWHRLPDESEVLMKLLAEARFRAEAAEQQRDVLVKVLEEVRKRLVTLDIGLTTIDQALRAALQQGDDK